MKKIVATLFITFSVLSSRAQTVFWQDDFENASAPDLAASSTRTPENNSGVGGPPNTGYFKRTNGSDISMSTVPYSGFSGSNFWAGEDHDTPFGAGNEEQQIEWTGINIAGKTGLTFKGLFGANSTSGSWDNFNTGSAAPGYGVFAAPSNDYIIVEYAIDAGAYTQLVAFFGDDITGPIGTAKKLKEDTNGDFIGDGTALNQAMTEFTKSIAGTGNTLKIKIRVYSNGGNEEWGIDNFRVTETVPCINPTLPTLAASPSVICNGASTTLSISTGSLNSATSWKWYTGSCGGTLVGTGTSITQSPSSTTVYYVRGEGGCVLPGACTSVTVTVNTPPATPGAISGTTTICSGTSNTYSVAAVSGAATYNWTLPGGWTGSSTTNTINASSNSSSGTISVTATNTCGTSAASSQVITVNAAPVLNAQTGDNSVCELNTVSFGVNASGSGLIFQWLVSADNGLTYSNIVNDANYSGANLSNLVLSNTPYAFNNYLYKCEISGTCGVPVYSTESLLTVFPIPAFVSHPLTVSTCENSSALYTVEAVSGMSYQWFENGNPLNEDSTYSGVYTDSLVIDSVTQAMNGNVYTCQIFGLCSPPALSNNASLIVYSGYVMNATATICSGTAYTFGAQTLTTTGAYSELFHTVNGCDSLVFLALTVNPSYHQNVTAAICGGDTYVFGTQTLTASGNYTETFQTINGCDSIVDLSLIVYPTYNQNSSATICSGATYTFGTQTLSATGNYSEIFQTINGCDSIVNLSLIVNSVDASIVQMQDTLQALTAGASYQWYTCNPISDPPISVLIPGETNQLFIASANGNYTLIVTLNGCSDTSSCNTVSTIGWKELGATSTIELYPNPVNEELNIACELEHFEYSILNALGDLVLKGETSKRSVNIDTHSLSNGIYSVTVKGVGFMHVCKVVVSH